MDASETASTVFTNTSGICSIGASLTLGDVHMLHGRGAAAVQIEGYAIFSDV